MKLDKSHTPEIIMCMLVCHCLLQSCIEYQIVQTTSSMYEYSQKYDIGSEEDDKQWLNVGKRMGNHI